MTTDIPTSFGVNAHSIRVAFHASDEDEATTDLNAPGATLAPTSTPTLPTPAPTDPSDMSRGAQQLPPGAWVGVGIGSTGGAIALFSGVVWLMRRRDKRRRSDDADRQAPATEVSTDSGWNWTPKLFLPSAPVELNATPGMYELDTRTTRR